MSTKDRMTQGPGQAMTSQCVTCARALPNNICQAYPVKIPEAILDNKVDHRKPHRGDGGLVYIPTLDRFGKTMTHIFDEPTVRARHRNTGRRDIV